MAKQEERNLLRSNDNGLRNLYLAVAEARMKYLVEAREYRLKLLELQGAVYPGTQQEKSQDNTRTL